MGRTRLAGLSPRRRVLVGGAVAVAGVLVVAGFLRACGGSTPGPPEQSRLGTVLLVPGYGGGKDSLAPLAARIRGTGRSVSVVTLPDDGTGDLLRQAGTLAVAAREAQRQGAPSVDVIGYSAGGVVVRAWVARLGGDRQARRVVTLGAPLHGARIAAAGSVVGADACPTACQQLAPGSSLLADLDRVPLPSALPWLSVWTEDDQTVTPPDSARLAGAVNVPLQAVCADARVSHAQLPGDPAVTAMVLEAIGTAPLTSPGRDDCTRLRAGG